MLTHPYEYRHENPTPVSTSEKIVPTHLEIYEVTIGVSLLTEISPTNKSTMLLNSRINS